MEDTDNAKVEYSFLARLQHLLSSSLWVKCLAINFAAKMNKKRKLAKFLIHLAVFLQNKDLFILKYYSIALPKIHNH